MRSPLPVLDTASPLYIFSDYGGEDEKKPFKTYSFLLCDIDRSLEALQRVEQVADSMLGARSLEYKKIEDVRLKAIAPFWRAIRETVGLAITIGIDQTLGPLARPGNVRHIADIDHKLIAQVEQQAPRNQEHLHRVLHFIGLLLRIATRENQQVHWITDNDRFFQNSSLRSILQRSAENLLSSYAPDLHRVDISVDTGSDVKHVKRLMWVPDLLAGAWWERLSQGPDATLERNSGLIVTGNAALTQKTQAILKESNISSQSFRSLAISLRKVPEENRIGHKLEWDSALSDSPF